MEMPHPIQELLMVMLYQMF